jgi:hypothetical protein
MDRSTCDTGHSAVAERETNRERPLGPEVIGSPRPFCDTRWALRTVGEQSFVRISA